MSGNTQRRREPGQVSSVAAEKNPSTPLPAVAAVTVSDRTCVAIFGIEWRTLRAWLDENGVPIRRIGRRPVVRIADVLAALEGDAPAWNEDEIVARAAAGRRAT